MCEVVVRDKNLGNFDNASAYTKVQSLKRSLIIERSYSQASEFRDVSTAKDICKPENENKILY